MCKVMTKIKMELFTVVTICSRIIFSTYINYLENGSAILSFFLLTLLGDGVILLYQTLGCK